MGIFEATHFCLPHLPQQKIFSTTRVAGKNKKRDKKKKDLGVLFLSDKTVTCGPGHPILNFRKLYFVEKKKKKGEGDGDGDGEERTEKRKKERKRKT